MAVLNKNWTFFYFIVVAKQKTKSNYVKFIEETFNFFGDILRNPWPVLHICKLMAMDF